MSADQNWQVLREALFQVVERYCNEADRRGYSTLNEMNWHYYGSGQFRYESRPIIVSDQALGALMTSWPQWHVMELASDFDPLRSHLNAFISGNQMGTYLSLITFALNTVNKCLRARSSDTDSSTHIAIEQINSLREITESSFVEIESLSLIKGLEITKPITLSSNVSVIKADAETIGHFIHHSSLPINLAGGNTPTAYIPESQWTALRRITREEKDIGSPLPTIPRTKLETPRNVAAKDIERLEHSLAISIKCVGPISLISCLFRLKNPVLSSGLGMQQGLKNEVGATLLDDADVTDVWNLLQNNETNASATLSKDRLVSAISKTRWEDRLLDNMIALEALLLGGEKDHSELRFKMAIRASLYYTRIKDDLSSNFVYDSIWNAYAIRNKIAHGVETSEAKTYKIAGTTVSLFALLDATEAIARELVRSALNQESGFPKTTLQWQELLDDWIKKMSAKG